MKMLYSLLADTVTKRDDGRYDLGGVRNAVVMTKYPTRIETHYVVALQGSSDELPLGSDDIKLFVYTGHTEEGAEVDLEPLWTVPPPSDINVEWVDRRGVFFMTVWRPLDIGIPEPMTWVFELRVRSLRLPQLRFMARQMDL